MVLASRKGCKSIPHMPIRVVWFLFRSEEEINNNPIEGRERGKKGRGGREVGWGGEGGRDGGREEGRGTVRKQK